MRFSLVVPTVDRTTELESLLDSLRRQTHKDFELVIVDQNPDDRLVPLLQAHLGAMRITHLKARRRGAARARNAGVEHAGGDVITFPDDDCLYPPDLLDKVARAFAGRPDVDGLTGRLIDEDGRDSNGRFHTEPGPIGRISVWSRAIEAAVFLRRSGIGAARFDEELGVGAGTAWGAGEVTDYLLRLLEKGGSLYYAPDLMVIHPPFVSAYDERTVRKAYSYGCGMGRVLRKHRMPLWFKGKWLLRPLGGTLLSAMRLSLPQARFRWATFRGRLKGLLS